MLDDDIAQRKIVPVGGWWAPRFNAMSARNEAANMVIQCSFAATAGKIMPDCDFHDVLELTILMSVSCVFIPGASPKYCKNRLRAANAALGATQRLHQRRAQAWDAAQL